MSNFPNFKTVEDETLYYEIFEENLTTYKYVLDKVKDELYGTGFGNYSNLPGSCFEVVYKITNTLINETTQKFRDQKPEYIRPQSPPQWAHPESSLHFTLGEK